MCCFFLDIQCRFGYAEEGKRLPTHLRSGFVPVDLPHFQLIGAAGLIMAQPLEDGSMANFGLLAFLTTEPAFMPLEIKSWLLNNLVNLVGPYPGPQYGYRNFN